MTTAQDVEAAAIYAKVREIDEAVIRADEAEKIAAWMVSGARLVATRHREGVDVIEALPDAVLDELCEGFEQVAAAIRAGKHRSTT